MARDRGLLDRLRQQPGRVGRSARPRTEDLYASVQDHLQRLLNTREGDSSAFPDYGLPALTEVSRSGRLEELRRRIEQSIRDFEPRLTAVRVQCVEPDPMDPLKIRFQISGRPTGVKDRVTFRFDTVVDAVGATPWRVTG